MPSPGASILCANATPHPRSSRGVPVGPRCSTGPSFITRHDPVPTIDLGDITGDEDDNDEKEDKSLDVDCESINYPLLDGPIETIENPCYDPNQPEIQKPAILLNINIGTLAHCLQFTPTPTVTHSFDEIFNSEPLITALQTSLRVSPHIPRTTREQLST
ncbi:hypothetical protein C349_00032 [Cryptococcus neoformans var. grubii Br795]|uniref:Uncharacterized protein n=1 Tax=Cryptococcus neoformans Tu259-1 TaxID=1230072 RepID=A0A854QND3_CRYNE|nr:hypothetical protein C368_00028 [Cryptococcus neoformans var. grubii 125.91]OXG31145.1 hypothetical protein C361_00031 [Cryptococcus neoformans var. grubii Tu259-1]OXG31319.1 hypothetical protein C360_04520 [Cryptococcus neoformans var. grubii Bt15]OXG41917.1 hypothetical protein C359_03333 [Cryptococcus neoformans var. grubii Bt120]OXG94504.1 hypothetical protein C349_00032 [Cryptococcus neoformans var. grubii Br795]